jgi:hypothetical protein
MIEMQKSNSDILLVSFGGLALQVGMRIPEFKTLLTPIDVNKAFFIDEDRCWYYSTYIDVINELKELISSNNFKHIIFYGCSAGGYAAILFGLLLEIDRVMAFQTQTFLSRKSRKKYNDKRWQREVEKVYLYSHQDQLDLWYYNYHKTYKTIIELFYCENFEKSKIHAELFYEKAPDLNIVLNKYQCDSYPLARELKQRGELLQIFKDRLR